MDTKLVDQPQMPHSPRSGSLARTAPDGKFAGLIFHLRTLRLVAVLLVGLAAVNAPAETPKRLFHVTFDKWDTQADEAGGDRQSSFAGSLLLRQPEGAYSRAGMRIEPGETLSYAANGNFNTRRGTLTFWIKPYMWQKDHFTRRIVFFHLSQQVQDVGVHFMVGRMEGGMLRFDLGLSHVARPDWTGSRTTARIPDWAADGKPQWHRIDATWDTVDDMELALYLDGKLEHRVPINVSIPASTDGRLSFIPLNDWAGSPFNNLDNTSLIDEIEVWNGPLTGAEIARAYTRQSGTALGGYHPDDGVRPPIKVELIPLYEQRAFLYKLALNNLPPPWPAAVAKGTAKLQARFAMPGKGATVAQDLAVTNRALEIRLPAPDRWPAGDYRLYLQLTDPSVAEPFVYTNVVAKPATPWLGSDIGLDDRNVPSPWEPLRRKGNAITCWGRTYRLDGAFPASVINQGQEMLTGPIRMRVRSSLGEQVLGPGPVRWPSVHSGKATYRGQAERNPAGLAFAYSGTVEFDGFILTTVRIIPPPAGCRVDRLELEIPLKSELVRYARNPKLCADGPGLTTVTQWDGKGAWATPFKPYLWVGNCTAGFDWLCESQRDWNNPPDAKPCQIVPAGETTFLRFMIVSLSAEIKQPLEYTFGFQASPVKPLRKGWRHLRASAGSLASEPYANATTIGYDFTFEYIGWFVPQVWPHDEPQERALGFANLDVKLQVLGHLGMKAFPYTSGVCIADNNPVWDFFAPVWQNETGPVSRGVTGGGYTTRRDGRKFSLTGADPRSWSPFLAYMADQLLANPAYQPQLGGIYVDNTSPYLQRNPYNGGGYETDAFGHSGYSYSILGLRDLALRLLRVIRKNKGDEGVLWLHAHNDLILPIHGLGDYFFPGEQYGYLVPGKRTFYMDHLPPEAWQVEMSARPYGVPQMLCHHLPTIDGRPVVNNVYPISQERAPTENIIAMCVLHDVLFNLNTLNRESLAEFFAIVDRTGMADAEFLPYWEPNGCSTDDKTVKISVYRTAQQVSAVLVNFSAEDKQVACRIEPAFFGWAGRPRPPFDERAKWGLPTQGNSFTVPVRAKNYAVVSFESQ